MIHEAIQLRIVESKIRMALSIAAPPLLIMMAWGTFAVDSPVLVTWILAMLAAVLGWVVLFEFPLSIDIAEEGITRNCVLRHQLLAWDEIQGITRPKRRGVTSVMKSGKQLILIDRRLKEDEIAFMETMAAQNGVKTVL